MSTDAALPGLDGRTPLGFLAALGVQTAFTNSEPPTLRWETSTGVPIIGARALDEIAERIIYAFRELVAGPAVCGEHVTDDLKFSTAARARDYLVGAHVGGGLPAAFAAAQVSEGPIARRDGRSKPSALHFVSGQMEVLGDCPGDRDRQGGDGQEDQPSSIVRPRRPGGPDRTRQRTDAAEVGRDRRPNPRAERRESSR